MHVSRKTLMAGLSALALACGCGAAFAGGPEVHTMTVALPGGGTAVVQYTGDVAPRVSFNADPVAAEFFGPDSPFAVLQRVSAQMDRDMAAMMRQVDMMSVPIPNFDRPFQVDLRSLPAGASEYSMVSTLTGNGLCSRSTQITSLGNGQKPKVVTHTSGDCGKSQATVQPSGATPDTNFTNINYPQEQTVPRAGHGI